MEHNADQNEGAHSGRRYFKESLFLVLTVGLACRSLTSSFALPLSIRPALLSPDTTEAEDVTYADVSVLRHQGQRREPGEGAVEYGEVKVAPGLRRTLDTNVDECVYAQPWRSRP